ncbi:MAG: chemotaxis protein MotA [Gammaproteobacteria bacterium]
MDSLSIIGIIVAFSAILLGQYLEGGHIGMLLNGPALLIVLGGTIGATMLQSPMPVFLRSMVMLKWVFVPPPIRLEQTMKQLLSWSRITRKEGLLGLEKTAKIVGDKYSRKALQLLIDGTTSHAIRETLELDAAVIELRDMQAARVFDGMGGYAPTLGILGAVIGLIHVMNNLADPSLLGQGIAVSFVATIYGVGLANLMFLPTGNKLKALIREEAREHEMIVIGVVAIADGENPGIIESRLKGLIY